MTKQRIPEYSILPGAGIPPGDYGVMFTEEPEGWSAVSVEDFNQ